MRARRGRDGAVCGWKGLPAAKHREGASKRSPECPPCSAGASQRWLCVRTTLRAEIALRAPCPLNPSASLTPHAQEEWRGRSGNRSACHQKRHCIKRRHAEPSLPQACLVLKDIVSEADAQVKSVKLQHILPLFLETGEQVRRTDLSIYTSAAASLKIDN